MLSSINDFRKGCLNFASFTMALKIIKSYYHLITDQYYNWFFGNYTIFNMRYNTVKEYFEWIYKTTPSSVSIGIIVRKLEKNVAI